MRRRKAMKLQVLSTLVLFLLLAGIVSAEAFQTGKIISITKREAQVPNKARSDQPTSNTTDDYDVVIAVGGTNYTALYRHHGDLEPAWTQGAEVQVQVAGKTMNVKKANGKTEKLKIVSNKPD